MGHGTAGRGTPRAGRAAIDDPDRLDALRRTGLGAAPDPEMERFAAWVRRALSVPTALVVLVQADRQVFPGMAGLREPYAAARSIPRSHSISGHVVSSGRPLVIPDARLDPLVTGNPAVPDVGVIAYAGIPLTDETGVVLGSLCAIDSAPRHWTDEEIGTLEQIARSCTTELRLRLARFDADTESDRRDRVADAARRSHDRSRMLLAASQAFTDTETVHDVRSRIAELLTTELYPVHVETVFHDRRGRPHRPPEGLTHLHGDRFTTSPDAGAQRERTPAALAIREQRVVHYGDRDALAARHPPEVVAALRELGLHTVVAAPVPGRAAPAGAILLGWARPDAVEGADLLTIATIAGYAGQALARARTLEHRTSVAHEMQAAMLTVLPRVDGLQMAARYSPADSRLNVGGDWYDAARTSDPDRPGDQVLDLSVGDVIGHDLPAVTLMGQARAMLRQAAWDHAGQPPSRVLRAFERADHGLGLGIGGTAVIAHLRSRPDGRMLLRWTNAGHPPPVLLHPDGHTELLTEHDTLFGFAFALDLPRTDHERVITPGSTLVVYTDGLVERPGTDLDTGTATLLSTLDTTRHGTPDEIVDELMATLPDDAHDDAVALAVRFRPEM